MKMEIEVVFHSIEDRDEWAKLNQIKTVSGKNIPLTQIKGINVRIDKNMKPGMWAFVDLMGNLHIKKIKKESPY